MPASSEKLQKRKQQLVRNAIWQAAIGLFAESGFENVTVDEIAAASGVSARSFFRYFSSKNDLMARGVLTYGNSLSAAIESFPQSSSLLEVMEGVTLEFARAAAAQPRTRQVIQIAERSPAAKNALLSSLYAIQDQVAAAFASRIPQETPDSIKSKLIAALTLSVLNTVITDWGKKGRDDISELVGLAFATLKSVVHP